MYEHDAVLPRSQRGPEANTSVMAGSLLVNAVKCTAIYPQGRPARDLTSSPQAVGGPRRRRWGKGRGV